MECLKKEMTKEQLIEAMLDRYDAPRETIERDGQHSLWHCAALEHDNRTYEEYSYSSLVP